MLRTLFTTGLLVALILPRLGAQQMEVGLAAYYADYLHGNATALGEVYDRGAFTCAHRWHPKGTLLRVTNYNNGKSVVVRVNDRGPYKDRFVVDLSLAAANALGMTVTGTAKVSIEPIGFSDRPVDGSGRPLNYSPLQSQTFTGAAAANQDLSSRGLPDRNYAFEIGKIQKIRPGQPGYVIQLGAYSAYQNATNQIGALQRRGISDVYLLEKNSPRGTTVYRVVLGVFDQRDDAETYRQRIKQQYQVDGIVTRLKD
jgi:rare lipoprotein A